MSYCFKITTSTLRQWLCSGLDRCEFTFQWYQRTADESLIRIINIDLHAIKQIQMCCVLADCYYRFHLSCADFLKDFLNVCFATGCDFKRSPRHQNIIWLKQVPPDFCVCAHLHSRLSGEDEWECCTVDGLCMHLRLKCRNKAPFSLHQLNQMSSRL